MVSNKKKSTVMSPIRRRMKKHNPSSGQNGQLVHWWLLIHSGLFDWGLFYKIYIYIYLFIYIPTNAPSIYKEVFSNPKEKQTLQTFK